MSLLIIKEIPSAEAPMDLLLLADPSEEKVRSYLPSSKCFAAFSDGTVVGVCAVQAREPGTYELMNIAVRPDRQRRGIGTELLKWVVGFFQKAGADQLEVGTGTFGYQLAFYQRQGFRVTRIDRDFFVKNYDQPIFEQGIQLIDMLRLTIRYKGGPADAARQLVEAGDA